MIDGRRRLLLLLAAAVVAVGSFFFGLGVGGVIVNRELISRYRDSGLSWRQELAAGEEEEYVRSQRDEALARNMQYVSINRELYVSGKERSAEARIVVDEKSEYGCIVSVIRDATGETLYRSGFIDPGKGIKDIRINSSLKKGYYPCTAMVSFYAQEDEYVGEMALKVVVIVRD